MRRNGQGNSNQLQAEHAVTPPPPPPAPPPPPKPPQPPPTTQHKRTGGRACSKQPTCLGRAPGSKVASETILCPSPPPPALTPTVLHAFTCLHHPLLASCFLSDAQTDGANTNEACENTRTQSRKKRKHVTPETTHDRTGRRHHRKQDAAGITGRIDSGYRRAHQPIHLYCAS